MVEYIERMKVISTIKGYEIKNCPEYMQDWVTNLKRAILQDITDGVMEIPAADVVEVRHGEWIQTKEPLGYNEVDCVECSACRESWIIEEDLSLEEYIEFWYYCPRCGAKMDGERKCKNG